MIVVLLAVAQEWTQFRGPNGTGISHAKGVPVKWTEKDFRWRVEFPGESHSQPVIWGDKIFVESARDEGRERMLICLRKEDGKELWAKTYPLSTFKKHNLNSFASSTPAVDKERVYATFADPKKYLVKAFDHSGKEIWSVNLGPFISQHGLGASPIVFEDKLIVPNDQDEESTMVALDLKTGATIWKCARRGAKEGTAYGTPYVLRRDGKPVEIITTSQAYGISSLDPKTGAINWEARVFDKRSVASPVVIGDLAIGTCGSGAMKANYLAAVRLGGKGDVTMTHRAYTVNTATPYVPTPVALGERLFLISDNGFASCIQSTTGSILWSARIAAQTRFFGSPVLVDRNIYCPSENGEVFVIEASDQFKLLGRSPLGEGTRSTPCVDGGRLYFKTFAHLICVGGQ